MARVGAIVLAAGQGRRMGADKALLELGGETAVERVTRTCRAVGVTTVLVVRTAAQAPLPDGLDARIVEVAAGEEMLASVQAGVRALPAELTGALVFPVDYAMVGVGATRAVVTAVAGGAAVALPIHAERPGHPIGLSRERCAAVLGDVGSLRDVVTADAAAVQAVPVKDRWVRHDLDAPADLAAARGALRAVRGPVVTEWMRQHRSVRAFTADPVPHEQLEWLVDSARYASTSSFIQAYSAVAVEDPARRADVAALCGDQKHVREAPVFLAICADLHKVARCCERHGKTMLDGPIEGFVEAVVDAALFAQNLLLAAESEGLGGCMIGAARQQPRQLGALLGLPPRVFVAFGMVLGRPAEEPVPRGRMPLPAVLHYERYEDAELDAALDAADEQMRAWARAINAQGGYGGRPVNEVKGYTDRMASKWSRGFGPREALAAHLRAMGFGLE